MSDTPTLKCAACSLVLPQDDFERFYTLSQAVRLGYGKPFDDVKHAHIPVDDRTVYSRIPHRVKYLGKYCRSCKPQKPFVDMSTDANIFAAANLGAFGPQLSEAQRYAAQVVSAKRKAVVDNRAANAPGRFIREQVLRMYITPAINWQKDLTAARLRDIEIEAMRAEKPAGPSVHDLPEYQAFAHYHHQFWDFIREATRKQTFKLPQRLMVRVTDPSYAPARNPDDALEALLDEKKGEYKFALALAINSLLKNKDPVIERFRMLGKLWTEYTDAAPRTIHKKPFALGIFEYLQGYVEVLHIPQDPGPYVHDPANPKGLLDWMYARQRFLVHQREKQFERATVANMQRSEEGKRPRGRPRKST